MSTPTVEMYFSGSEWALRLDQHRDQTVRKLSFWQCTLEKEWLQRKWLYFSDKLAADLGVNAEDEPLRAHTVVIREIQQTLELHGWTLPYKCQFSDIGASDA